MRGWGWLFAIAILVSALALVLSGRVHLNLASWRERGAERLRVAASWLAEAPSSVLPTVILPPTATPTASATSTPTPTPTSPATQTPTPLPTASPTPSADPTPTYSSYKVRSGDTPASIALGFGITAEELMAANNIVDPSALQVGQVLVIPVPATATATPTLTITAAPVLATSPTSELGTAATLTAGQEPGATETLTPRPTVIPTAVAVAAALESTYKVRAGDTISAIAAQLGVTAQALMAANGIDDPRLLRVGQVLQIPAPGGVAPPQVTATPQPPPTSTPLPAETSAVAMRFGAPVLVNPEDNRSYSGGDEAAIELIWESVGALAEDEEYVVYVGVVREDGETDWIQTEPQQQALQSMSWWVPTWMREHAHQESGGTFVWYVQVEQVLRDGSGEVVRDESGGVSGQPISLRSDMRHFSWR